MNSIDKLPGYKLSDMIRKRHVSSVEVMEHFISKYEKINPKINAFTYAMVDYAMHEAKELDDKLNRHELVKGGLLGVPVVLKDFLPSKKGWRNSHGGVPALVQEDEYDSEFCKAAEAQGAIVIGKTNAPAFGFRGCTDNIMYGPTSTPFDITRNSGGSSGGSASAVGAGLALIGEGGDAGGSIRIPAAWCGCYGFKPSAGAVPNVCRPDAWTASHPYCCGGPITRSVHDADLILNNMIHYNPRDPISVMMDKTGIGQINPSKKLLNGLKIAVTYDFNLFPYPEDDIARAVDRVADVLVNGGATRFDLNFHFKHDLRDYEEAWLRGISVDSSIDLELLKRYCNLDLIGDHPDQLPEEFIKWNNKAFSSTMLDYRAFHEIRSDVLDAHQDIFDYVDLIVAPVTGCMPVKNRTDHTKLYEGDDGLTYGPSSINGKPVDNLIGFSYTFLENFIGTPAASIPAGLSKDGLPIGVQLIAPRYKDATVLNASYFIEAEMPWMDAYPDHTLTEG